MDEFKPYPGDIYRCKNRKLVRIDSIEAFKARGVVLTNCGTLPTTDKIEYDLKDNGKTLLGDWDIVNLYVKSKPVIRNPHRFEIGEVWRTRNAQQTFKILETKRPGTGSLTLLGMNMSSGKVLEFYPDGRFAANMDTGQDLTRLAVEPMQFEGWIHPDKPTIIHESIGGGGYGLIKVRVTEIRGAN